MIGIAIAAPVGPIGMLCIRRTLEIGLIGALAVGLGAALADSVFGVIAATGMTAVSHFLLSKEVYIKIIGGSFLIFLAYREITASSSSSGANGAESKTLSKLTTQVFFLTLANPATILSFIAIFAIIGGAATTPSEMIIMVLGIFLGSMTWWLFLGTMIVSFRHKLPERWIDRIRYLSVLILGGFGVLAILSVLLDLV